MTGPTPYLCVQGASDAIAFYVKAFAAEEVTRYTDTDGRVGHAELRLAGGTLLLADEYPEIGFVSPATLGGAPFHIFLAVPDVDAWFRRARDAGARVVKEPTDEDQGDRRGKVLDPFGFTWHLARAGAGS